MQMQIDDILINYEDFGAGEAIIFLHGNGESLHCFDKSVEYFSKSFRCICIDSRGHGKSTLGNRKLTIPQMANDLIEFIDKLGLDNITLVGFSDGGNIALEAAAQCKKIKNLVAVGANLNFDGLKFSIRASIIACEIFFALTYFLPSSRKGLRLYKIMSHQPKITTQKLNQISAKALIVEGEHDMIKPSHTQKIHNNIADSRHISVKNADHFLFAKNNSQINKIIEDFIFCD